MTHRFLGESAERISWYESWNAVSNHDFVNGKIEWFSGGKLNAAITALTGILNKGMEKRLQSFGRAMIQINPENSTDLLKEVSRFSNALKELGVQKGDRVCLYMQMIPELAIAVLACARIGAVHSVVFGAFSSDSLKERINDSKCKILVTQDTGVRGAKQNIPMKLNADNAVLDTPSIEHVIVVSRTGEPIEMDSNRDIWWHEAISNVSSKCEPETWMLRILYLFCTHQALQVNQKVLHTTGGYLTYVSLTHELIFDYHPDDIYWCTADLGWITAFVYNLWPPKQ